MAHWERRHADTLVSAISAHRKNNPHLESANRRLAEIQNSIGKSARTVNTTPEELDQHRERLCSVCRSAALYACDVPLGWSVNCAFLRANLPELRAA